MNWLSWIIFGGLAGWVASIISKKNENMGMMKNIIVGIVGSWVGGFLMSFLGAPGVTGFNLRSCAVAIIGSCALLWFFNAVNKK